MDLCQGNSIIGNQINLFPPNINNSHSICSSTTIHYKAVNVNIAFVLKSPVYKPKSYEELHTCPVMTNYP